MSILLPLLALPLVVLTAVLVVVGVLQLQSGNRVVGGVLLAAAAGLAVAAAVLGAVFALVVLRS